MMVGIVIIAALAAPACFYMIFSSTTEWCCLQEGEIFEYKIKKEGMKNGTLNIFIKDGKSQEIKSKITIDDIRTSAYPVELRKCGAYYVKLFNYDSINAEKEKGYRSELTVHDYGNNEKKLIVLSETKEEYQSYYSPSFRTDETEKYLALIKGWYGEPEEHAVVIKDLETLEDVHIITLSELMQEYEIGLGTLDLSFWYKQDFKFTILDGGETFFHLDVTNGDMKVYY